MGAEFMCLIYIIRLNMDILSVKYCVNSVATSTNLSHLSTELAEHNSKSTTVIDVSYNAGYTARNCATT